MFIRKRGGSHQLIETYREGGKVKQRQIANLGPCKTIAAAIAYWEDHIARFNLGPWEAKAATANIAALRSVKSDTTRKPELRQSEQPPKPRVVSKDRHRPIDTTPPPVVSTGGRPPFATTAAPPAEPRRVAAVPPAPVGTRSVDELREMAKRARERESKPERNQGV